MRDLSVVPVMDLPVLPQGHRHPERFIGHGRRHADPLEYVVSGHPQLNDAGSDLARDDVVDGEGVPEPVRRGGEVERVLPGPEFQP